MRENASSAPLVQRFSVALDLKHFRWELPVDLWHYLDENRRGDSTKMNSSLGLGH